MRRCGLCKLSMQEYHRNVTVLDSDAVISRLLRAKLGCKFWFLAESEFLTHPSWESESLSREA